MFSFHRYLFLFVLFAFLICFGDGFFLDPKVDLRIINDMGNGLVLNVHCKSKDDDLGIHNIAPNQYYEFRFRPSYWFVTLFYCEFWWGSESHWFDIYVQKRDHDRCDKECWWKVSTVGPCLLDKRVQKYTLCENWNKNLRGLGKNTTRMDSKSEYLDGGERKAK